ncbi:FAD-binding and (Fe-S)-binding domain-containing protein [Cyclobacterium jeungdonense]|uniref:FAD-linked oxidase C-terminal domain-containing protein n=1 Tax=Cyclobacterium jeungdonense TaxID=708087 RepID=A0ABT8CDS6_9BACT|nr:FAD-binding and (Fe-S)-binding domain-containing protein [Cyclobacterium jeungdonense]MDN3689895.1 FAD-linked oxidase C-terminal domain-containing protein [Cyclobacterium jeungdonense]
MSITKKDFTPLLKELARELDGELHFDSLMRTLYATDASVYRSLPLAVALPKNTDDLKKLIRFATDQGTSLIPRTAGTSLAGQCVGEGIVVDVSKYMNQAIEFNKNEGWIRVQPGVVRNELNNYLKEHGYFFSPITSTATRAMIGGMVGNNSCGTTSIVYGSTREHVLELKVLLSDGSEAVFKSLTPSDFELKCKQDNMEGALYRHIREELEKPEIQKNIREHFPKASIHRRNTGYAVDYLLETQLFSDSPNPFDFCKLLCGSEGTLAITTEIKIHLDRLPEPFDIVVAAHFESIHESMKAAQVAMKQSPTAVELMDKIILDCTKENVEQSRNRDFVEGDPKAILMVEFRGRDIEEARAKGLVFVDALKQAGLGYAFPVIGPDRTDSAWQLRSAGLGLLANIPGDKKAVACIEDTAVAIEDLADYIDEFAEIIKEFGQEPVYYAHAGAGEIHLRPILDLKKAKDVEEFYQISEASAKLVKKYRGSLSGEHGDGRVRAAFIPMMVGQENYDLFKRVKATWDPKGIFNPGKIVDAPPMNTSLRYEPEMKTPDFPTKFDFSNVGGILRMAEKCNGSGDCRKLPNSGGGTMCPSYQATRYEKDTTRGRANTLREFLTNSQKENPFDHPEIKEVMDLCLSCKGCTSECPSNVDMSTLKAEFQYQYQKANGVPLRSRAFAYINKLNGLGSSIPGISNFFLTNAFFGGGLKKFLGVASERNLPTISKQSLRNWYKMEYSKLSGKPIFKSLYFFCDEFTNHNDTATGIKAITLLRRLGYEVKLVDHAESGRGAISKGLLDYAQKMAEKNVSLFSDLVNADSPLIGLEPSAILSFRDEYPRLVTKGLREKAKSLKFHCEMVDEFLAKEIIAGNISPEDFTSEPKYVHLHGHCHQKALSSVNYSKKILELPTNYKVNVIPSGCCGMAGSFGYEKEHYKLSMQIGEMVLFPAVRDSNEDTLIAAPGTSCRHQIADGTGRKALHPVEILFEALKR